MSKMVWWKVSLNGEEIDNVPYAQSYRTAEEVKRSLVNHDGYDPNIVVERETPEPAYPYHRLERETCVELLEAACIQCYDSEDAQTLQEAVKANVEDGTIDRADLPETPDKGE
jgi:hypothetical protein